MDTDPSFALAWAKLAMARYVVFWIGGERTAERLETIKEAADSALSLDPNLAEAHVALGLYYFRFALGADYDRALREMNLALGLQPNNAFFRLWSGAINRRYGQFQRAAEDFALSADLNPADPNATRDAALTYIRLRDYDRAEHYLDRADAIGATAVGTLRQVLLHLMRDGNVVVARQVLEDPPPGVDFWRMLSTATRTFEGERPVARVLYTEEELLAALDSAATPGSIGSYVTRAELHGKLGDVERARAYADSAIVAISVEREGGSLRENWLIAQECLAQAGAHRFELAREVGARLLSLKPIAADALYGPGVVGNVAEMQVLAGDYEEAIELLDRVLSVPSGFSAKLLEIDPTWAPLRSHPRFQALLERYGH